jgi:hypothetical protein
MNQEYSSQILAMKNSKLIFSNSNSPQDHSEYTYVNRKPDSKESLIDCNALENDSLIKKLMGTTYEYERKLFVGGLKYSVKLSNVLI